MADNIGEIEATIKTIRDELKVCVAEQGAAMCKALEERTKELETIKTELQELKSAVVGKDISPLVAQCVQGECKPLISALQELREVAARQTEQIAHIDDSVKELALPYKCPKCSARLSEDMETCPGCGKPIIWQEEDEEEELEGEDTATEA